MGNPGYMHSPNYPSEYDNGKTCTWTLVAPPGRKLILRFLAFKLEPEPTCDYDNLQIFDGENAGVNVTNSTLCGTQTPNDIESSRNAMFLKFISDDGESYTGFNISYQMKGKS